MTSTPSSPSRGPTSPSSDLPDDGWALVEPSGDPVVDLPPPVGDGNDSSPNSSPNDGGAQQSDAADQPDAAHPADTAEPPDAADQGDTAQPSNATAIAAPADLDPDPAPFDDDFVARALASGLSGQPIPPTRSATARLRRVIAPLPRPRPHLPRSRRRPPPPPRPDGVGEGRRHEPVDEKPIIVTELLGADGRLFQFAPPKPAPTEIDRSRGLRVALRTLLRQRRRMVLSVVAVALGVGYLAGALSLLQRVGDGLAEQAGASTERADLVIEGSIADDGPLQQVRKLVPDAIVDLVRNAPGVAAVEPRLESKSTLILGANGRPVVGLGLTERPLGANYPESARLNPYRFVGDGQRPIGTDQVVIDSITARAAGVKVGGTVLIAGKVGLHPYRVVGIVEPRTGALPSGSSLALFDTTVARKLFELGPDDNAIAIALTPSADADAVAQSLRAALPIGAELSTASEYTEHRRASFEKSFTLIRALLIGFAALALVVGAFTVANSMALLFDHRRRGFAMLRLMGASPQQLVGAATAESVLGGALAGVVGLVLGLAVGAAIEALIRSMGTPLPTSGPVVTWWIPLLAVVIGAAVTTTTALSPARHAARTPPVQAVTGADDRPPTRPIRVTAARWLATIALLAGVAALLAAAFGGAMYAPLAAGVGAALGVVLVLLPRLLSGVVGLVTALLLGRSVALRRMSTLRSRQARTRAASTTAALLLSAAVVTGLTVLSSSFLESIDGEIRKAVTADLVVDSATFANGGLSADLVPTLRRQKDVAAVTGWRVGALYVGPTLWRAAGIDGATMFQVLDLDVEGTPPASTGIDDVVISQQVADQAGVKTGDMLTVQFQNAAVLSLRVRAVFRSDMRVLLGDVIVDSSVMAANLPQSIDVMAFVKLTPDAPRTVRTAIETTARKYGAQHVLTPDQLVSSRAELLRGFARVIQWMLAFSIVLALVGVANTLQLGVNERRRELGLIRAVGATRAQVLRLVLAEAAALSLIGTVFGMAIGAIAAWATVKALASVGLTTFVAPLLTLTVVAVVSVGLGLAAALVPAWRASRIPLLDAIADGGDEAPRRRRPGRRRATAPSMTTATATANAATATGDRHTTSLPRNEGGEPPAIVDRAGAGAPVSAPPLSHEVPMALRCYNCGYEPGPGETCAACGAAQTVSSAGLFGARNEPVVTEPLTQTFPTAALSDIVDAAVVENGVVVEPAPTAPTFPTSDTAPPAEPASFDGSLGGGSPSVGPPNHRVSPFQAAASDTPTTPVSPFGSTDPNANTTPTADPATNGQAAYLSTAAEGDDGTRAHSPLFESRPTPSQAHDPMKSPFGQDAQPLAPRPEPEPAPDDHEHPGAGIFSAGAAPAPDAGEVEPEPARAPSGPPPAFVRTVTAAAPTAANVPTPPPAGPLAGDTAPSTADGNAAAPPLPPSAHDTHGLAASVSRLSPAAQIHGRVPFSIAGALLAEHEVVMTAVAGSSLGMPTVVLATDRRVLVVSDHGYVPEVEAFALGSSLGVHGRHANDQASLTFTQGDRLITVDQIVDVGIAVELANTVRHRGPGEF